MFGRGISYHDKVLDNYHKCFLQMAACLAAFESKYDLYNNFNHIIKDVKNIYHKDFGISSRCNLFHFSEDNIILKN